MTTQTCTHTIKSSGDKDSVDRIGKSSTRFCGLPVVPGKMECAKHDTAAQDELAGLLARQHATVTAQGHNHAEFSGAAAASRCPLCNR